MFAEFFRFDLRYQLRTPILWIGAFFFIFDELQIDAFYGAGWATDGSPSHMGLALAIKEAF